MSINWGILGCGHIATTFLAGLAHSQNGIAYACAARDPKKAKAFAAEHDITIACESYQALVDNKDVDAIYIATTHNAHYECVKQCLNAGKHVLCEKPLTVNAAQAAELIELATANDLFLMEAVWTRFLPAIQSLQQDINAGLIGDVVTVKADFSLCRQLPLTHRLRDPELAGGALLDLGIYPLTIASIVFQQAPEKIMGHAVMDSTGVDERSFYTIDYGQGRTALLTSGYTQDAPCEAIISGTLGHIKVPFFLGAQSYELTLIDSPSETKPFPFPASKNFFFEIEHAQECIAKGLTQSPILPLSKTLEMMTTMDALRAQWGLVYPFEQ